MKDKKYQSYVKVYTTFQELENEVKEQGKLGFKVSAISGYGESNSLFLVVMQREMTEGEGA